MNAQPEPVDKERSFPPLRDFVDKQQALLERANPGRKAGVEFEYPLRSQDGLSFQDDINTLNIFARTFIDVWNQTLAAGSLPEAQQDGLRLQVVESTVTPEDVAALIEAMSLGIAPDEAAVPAGKESIDRLQAVNSTGYTVVGTANGMAHWDNAFLFEIAGPPSFSIEANSAQAFTQHLQSVLSKLEDYYPNILQQKGAIAHAVRETPAVYTRSFATDTPLNTMTGLARHPAFLNERIGNGGLSMRDAGLHITTGLTNKERLGDVLRVLAGITPALMTLTENSTVDGQPAVRGLSGGWLGQNPHAQYPRMGMRFYPPDLSAKQVFGTFVNDLLDAPMIAAFKATDKGFTLAPYLPAHHAVSSSAYVAQLYQQHGAQAHLDYEAVLQQQMKNWGPLRIRLMEESIGELLVEYRPLDTQTPENGLALQGVVQTLLQNEKALDAVLQHLEEAEVVPMRGMTYTAEALTMFEQHLRETALRALSGRDENGQLVPSGVAAAYQQRTADGWQDTTYSLAATVQCLIDALDEHQAPAASLAYLRERMEEKLYAFNPLSNVIAAQR
jgi:hypothetical protein